MAMTVEQRIAGRFEAAKINGGAKAAQPRGNGRYTVEGRKGDRYTVHVVSLDEIRCDCAAAIKGNGAPCWHAAAAYLRHIADSITDAA